MALQLLHDSTSLQLFHDTERDWLYLDWQGHLTLSAVQAGWLQLTRCLLARPYACVLNSNTQVTYIDYAVGPWLLRGFERFMLLSGTCHLAWVHAHTPWGFSFAERIATALPQLKLNLFADEEQAVGWLARQYTPSAPGTHPPEALARLHHLARALERKVDDLLAAAA